MASSAKKPKTGDENVPAALVEHAVAWSATNGLGMVVNDDKGLFTSTHLPFSLLPYGEREREFVRSCGPCHDGKTAHVAEFSCTAPASCGYARAFLLLVTAECGVIRRRLGLEIDLCSASHSCSPPPSL